MDTDSKARGSSPIVSAVVSAVVRAKLQHVAFARSTAEHHVSLSAVIAEMLEQALAQLAAEGKEG